MALRALCFGLRFRDKGRTLRVTTSPRDSRSYLVEVERRGRETRRREHASLETAVQDFARAWRNRLH